MNHNTPQIITQHLLENNKNLQTNYNQIQKNQNLIINHNQIQKNQQIIELQETQAQLRIRISTKQFMQIPELLKSSVLMGMDSTIYSKDTEPKFDIPYKTIPYSNPNLLQELQWWLNQEWDPNTQIKQAQSITETIEIILEIKETKS